jgi:DNA-binding CsgD family transcriptional regulator
LSDRVEEAALQVSEPLDPTPERAELVGRSADCAVLANSLDTSIPGPTAVLLTGEAGIGKTALWEWAAGRFAADGYQVLQSRASAAEARYPWVGMTDLLRTVPAEIVADLPEPQRRALAVVALQAGWVDGLDERAVAMALLSTLELMSAAAPVLIAIDDLPYIDTASAAAVAFALRRLDGRRPVRLLATVRGDDWQLPVVRDLPDNRVVARPIGPLTLGALFELLQVRGGIRLARPLLMRVHETSGGNPLYALELARALDLLEITPHPGVPLPVPTGLTALVEARVSNLPPDLLEIVATTAASWRFTGTAADRESIERAVRAGLIVLDRPVTPGAPRVMRAVHPLVGAAAYEGLSDASRRALHERLALAADDPIERVRHQALAAVEPHPDLADALDAAADSALTAGVPDVAVELAQLSLEHSVEPTTRPARLDRLADARLRAGDSRGAWEAQSTAMMLTAAGPERARRRIRLAEIATEVTSWDDAARELELALDEAAGDDVVLAEVMLTLAAVTDDIEVRESYAVRAVDLLDRVDDPDPVVLSGALAQAAGARFRAGTGLDHVMFERAIAIEQKHPARRLSDRADASYAALLKYADDLDGAEARLTALLHEARALGDLSSIAYSLSHLAHCALWRGDLAQGRAYAEEHVQVASQGELAGQGAQARYNLGLAMAYQGQLDDATTLLQLVFTEGATSEWMRHRADATLGFIALSRNDSRVAVAHLDAWYAALKGMHFGEPGYSRSHLDYLCALAASGRMADANAVTQELEEQARRSGRESAAAVALTGLAMVESGAGRAASAQAAVTSALDWYANSPLRFDRARTLLISGQIHRRAKAKSRARDLLTQAEQEFATFGAVAWRDQAAAELARVNVRPRAPEEMTETERRVAELAAAGLTNQQVADRMFLAVKTVEANLARAYRKLGIRSRAELGARLGPPTS